ncbi:MAG: hypothetical protein WDA06_07365 [Phenylobacterium sp.]
MLFDKLCKIVENLLPEYRKIVAASKLFIFPGRAHGVLPKEVNREQQIFLYENFFLPFPIVALEDTASCILLGDTTDKQQSFDEDRIFIEIEDFAPERCEEYDPNRVDGYGEKFKEWKESFLTYSPY